LFLDTFGLQGFPHADELISVLRQNEPDESWTTCREISLDDDLRRVYRVRAAHLASAPPSPSAAPGLADDVGALSRQFDQASDQKLQVWHTRLRSGTVYLWFVRKNDQRIAGCVTSADQRI